MNRRRRPHRPIRNRTQLQPKLVIDNELINTRILVRERARQVSDGDGEGGCAGSCNGRRQSSSREEGEEGEIELHFLLRDGVELS